MRIIITSLNGNSFKFIRSVQCGDDADNVRYDQSTKRIYVGYGSGALAVLDAKSGEKLADIKLVGHPESFRLETGGPRIFVNVPKAEHLSGHPRANERDVAFNKSVIGVLVRSDKQQIVGDEARHQNDRAHASENLHPAPAFAGRRWTRFGRWGSNVGRLVGSSWFVW